MQLMAIRSTAGSAVGTVSVNRTQPRRPSHVPSAPPAAPASQQQETYDSYLATRKACARAAAIEHSLQHAPLGLMREAISMHSLQHAPPPSSTSWA